MRRIGARNSDLSGVGNWVAIGDLAPMCLTATCLIGSCTWRSFIVMHIVLVPACAAQGGVSG
jgi:hypothetical protein